MIPKSMRLAKAGVDTGFRIRSCSTNKPERDDVSRKTHPAPLLGHVLAEQTLFPLPGSTAELEEGQAFTPKFDADGLLTCVATDAHSGEVLMVAHMDARALAKTIATGEAWYFSRSRRKLWRKGESSGHVQKVVEMRTDCDQDAVWIKVEQARAGACHTGRRSCF
jgi:phosphoribosyl-AMP cyclohydrolase